MKKIKVYNDFKIEAALRKNQVFLNTTSSVDAVLNKISIVQSPFQFHCTIKSYITPQKTITASFKKLLFLYHRPLL